MERHMKLVRDNIPNIIRQNGHECICSVLSDNDYLNELDAKLNEEVAEYQESKSLEELADTVEVILAILKARGWTLEELEEIRKSKAETRGGFDGKIFLETVVC